MSFDAIHAHRAAEREAAPSTCPNRARLVAGATVPGADPCECPGCGAEDIDAVGYPIGELFAYGCGAAVLFRDDDAAPTWWPTWTDGETGADPWIPGQ